MRVYVAMVAALWVSGCVDSNSVQCKNGQTCPGGTACDEMHEICVEPDQLTACEGLAQADDCTFGENSTAGKCTETVCLVPECGNKVKDIGEACEDHNVLDKDGCSSDCKSDETCGNGITDLAVGEACDDGNKVNADGCTAGSVASGGCVLETASWIDATAVVPPARTLMTMAYDANRDAIVMPGGIGYANALASDTYEWRGEWTPAATLFAPPPLRRAAAAYHHALGRVIVTGGVGVDSTIQARMNAWDGTTWTASDAPALADHGAAYDSRRKKLVVFGGRTDDPDPDKVTTDKTWEFDGVAWTEVTPATTRPTPRLNPAMTYDPEHGLVIMYGGYDMETGLYSRELWAFDGVDWSLRSNNAGPTTGLTGVFFAYHVPSHAAILFGGIAQCAMAPCPISGDTWKVAIGTPAVWTKLTPMVTMQPSSRYLGAMVANGHGQLVLFGGTEGTPTYPTDTWIFENNDWHVAESPDNPRYGAGAVIDTHHRRLVVFGGSADGLTWELSDTGWKQWDTLLDSTAPKAFRDLGMAYDEKNHEVVAFGGLASSGYDNNDTWTWDGSGSGAWTKETSTGALPPPTRRGQLVFDSKNQRVLLFGPTTEIRTNPPTLTNGTVALWAWDGTSWTQLAPAHTPPPRLNAIVGFDRARGELVLFGGNNGSAANPIGLQDTWVYDGTDWREVVPPAGAARPPAVPTETITIGQAEMAWNPARSRLTMLDSNVNIWEWQGTHWQLVETTTRPERRYGFSLLPSRDGHGLSLLFGEDSTTSYNYAPWHLRWTASTPTESCARDVDLDVDGASGCDDPDCWTRCTPSCPPDTSCPTGAPSCGDNVCDPNEDCYSCGDCMCGAVCGDFVCGTNETVSNCVGDCP